MYHKTLADGFFMFAALSIFLAMIGWKAEDVWLASTQWMLIGIFMLLVAIYVKLSTEDDEKILKGRGKRTAKVVKASRHLSFRLTK